MNFGTGLPRSFLFVRTRAEGTLSVGFGSSAERCRRRAPAESMVFAKGQQFELQLLAVDWEFCCAIKEEMIPLM